MRLNRAEMLLVNNPFRAWVQRNHSHSPVPGCPDLLDCHTSLVHTDRLHLRPGNKFTPLADALLIDVERCKGPFRE